MVVAAVVVAERGVPGFVSEDLAPGVGSEVVVLAGVSGVVVVPVCFCCCNCFFCCSSFCLCSCGLDFFNSSSLLRYC